MEPFSALLAVCEGSPPVTRGFSSQRPVMQSFDIFFDVEQTAEQTVKMLRIWDTHCDVTVMWYKDTVN